MAVEHKNWLTDEVIPNFKVQISENPLKNVTLVADSSDVVDSLKKSLGSQLQFTTFDEIAHLNSNSQDLVVINNLVSSKKTDLDKLLHESLRLLHLNGSAIVCDFMDGLSTKAITDLSSKFDSFKANVDGVDKGFKLYCMNQLRDNNDKIGLCWILQAFGSKNEASDSEKMTRSFLDHTQYTEENIEAYEWIFGEDFISPGGIDENRRFLSYFDKIEAGKKMLDIGCGIGGSPRQVSKELQIDVLGCDISANMLAFAIDRSRVLNDKRVRYLLADAVEYKFEPNSFDYVYSRDCVQHIDELQRLFKNIYNSLKPGGEFIVTMYGKGAGELSEEFLHYVKDRKYTLRSLNEVVEFAKHAGFKDVEGENITKRFEEILHQERAKVVNDKQVFMDRFSAKKYEALLSGWEQKLRFIEADNHNWLKIKCVK